MVKLKDIKAELRSLQQNRCDKITCNKCNLRQPLHCKATELQEQIWFIQEHNNES